MYCKVTRRYVRSDHGSTDCRLDEDFDTKDLTRILSESQELTQTPRKIVCEILLYL